MSCTSSNPRCRRGCDKSCLDSIAAEFCARENHHRPQPTTVLDHDASSAHAAHWSECQNSQTETTHQARQSSCSTTGSDTCKDHGCRGREQSSKNDNQQGLHVQHSNIDICQLGRSTSPACGKGCCIDSVSANRTADLKFRREQHQTGDNACCKPDGKDKGCGGVAATNNPRVEAPAFGGTCCREATPIGLSNDLKTAKEQEEACKDACCQPAGTDGCGSDQYATPSSNGCCENTLPPGEDDDLNCLESCCCSTDEKSSVPSSSLSACADHLQAAFDRFERFLRRGQCLCRKMIEEFNFCCCCGQKQDACSGTVRAVEPAKSCIDEKTQSSEAKSSSKDQNTTVAQGVASEFVGRKLEQVDIESVAAREYVVLSVTGMTCTGCSRKMQNVLRDIPGLYNTQVTFVSGTAAFELDTNAARVEYILPLVEKRTGFKLSRVLSDHQQLDVLLSDDAAAGLNRNSADRTVYLEKLKAKRAYRITYDPHVVGARSLLPPDSKLVPPAQDPSQTEGRKRLVSMTWATALTAVLTIPVVVLAWSKTPVPLQTRGIVSLVLATFVQAIAVPEFYVGAIKSLVFSRVIEMDMLVVISITAAYVYSVVAYSLTESGTELEQEAFFETSSLLITLVLLGRLMAAIARMRAVSAISLRSLQAHTALIIQHDGRTAEIDARLLQFGDVFRVPAHGRVVTDGIVMTGFSAVNESMLTGESEPVNKQAGDAVIAGTINDAGPLDVRLTRLPNANSISDIRGLVENALGAKPRIQDLADKVAAWFVPVVVGIAIVVFAVWIAVAVTVRNDTAGGAVRTAITYAIAVLAISCPCALGLAVPMVLVIAGGVAARSGVVIKEADALERGHKVTDVLFDKTGTLTTGDLTVAYEGTPVTSQVTSAEALELVKALVEGNTHPVSSAISRHLGDPTGPGVTPLDNAQSIPGCGIKGEWKGRSVKAGNPYWLLLSDHPKIGNILDDGLTMFCVTVDDDLVAAYGLRSTIRVEASYVVTSLQRRGIRCHVVSGDHEKAARTVAAAVDVSSANVLARCTPAKKKDYVEQLQSDGRIVLFCGDGTNDAVAIAQANVGVQIGTASDVTKSVCSVTLLGGLDGIIIFLDTSKRAFFRIAFNFVWSAVYNVFAILLAAGALQAVGFRIPPAYAGLGEIVSVMPVVLTAVSLVWRTKW